MNETAGFGALPEEYCRQDDSRVVILPVPFDGTSTWKKGADKGPAAIIDASANVELYDIETDSEAYLQGIFTDEPVEETVSVDRMVAEVQQRTAAHLRDEKFVVTIGGEHSVSIGAVRAHARHIGGMSVLQLDAHSDLRAEYEGSENNHACVMARIKEMCPIVQVGIRSMDVSEKEAMDPSRVFFAQDLHSRADWFDEVVELLSEKVYVTIDLDVFDPSIMPATGTPEPGGLLWYDVLTLLEAVCRQKTLVGFDVVELCPVKNHWAADFLAAKLIYKLLSYKYRGGHE